MKIGRILTLLSCLTAACMAVADGITISSISSRLDAEAYVLDGRLEFNFVPEIADALEHGVAIIIDVTILIKRERNWVWDPKVKEETLSFRLEQHPLSKLYLVTDIGSDNRRQFASLADAMEYIGTIDSHFLINRTVLREDDRYTGMIKAEINTETLPAVIRSEAAVSKKLRLDSPWLEWLIKE